jgi:hypothetical protein
MKNSVRLFIVTLCTGVSFYFLSTGPSPLSVPVRLSAALDAREIENRFGAEAMDRYVPSRDQMVAREAAYRSFLEQHPAEDCSLPRTGLGSSNSVSGTWQERGSNNIAGRTRCADYDANADVLYIVTSGGHLWKSKSDGSSWQSINDQARFRQATSFYIIRNGSMKRLFLTTGFNQLYRTDIAFGNTKIFQLPVPAAYYSDDDGMTWKKTDIFNINNSGLINGIKKAVIGYDNHIYVLAEEWNNSNMKYVSCVYQSTDLGNSFQKICTLQAKKVWRADIWIDREHSSQLFVADGIDFYSWDNNGLKKIGTNAEIRFDSYDDHYNNALPFNEIYLSGTLSNGEYTFYLFYFDRNGNKGEVYRSNNSGKDWVKKNGNIVGQYGSGEGTNVIAICRTNPDIVFIALFPYCLKSVNGGSDCNQNAFYHMDFPAVYEFVDKNGKEFQVACNDGGVGVSFDHLTTLSNIAKTGLRNAEYYAVCTQNSVILAGSQDQGMQGSSNYLPIRDYVRLGGGDVPKIISSDGGKSIWYHDTGSLLVYADNVYSVSEKKEYYYYLYNPNDQNVPISNTSWSPAMAVFPDRPNQVLFGGGKQINLPTSQQHITLFKITATDSIRVTGYPFDFGEGATDISNYAITAIAISPLSSNYFYVGTKDGRLFYSTDAGVTWNKSTTSPLPEATEISSSSILPSKTTLGTVYFGGVGFSNAPVYGSTDNGKTFAAVSNGLPPTFVHKLAMRPDGQVIYAATEHGPFGYRVSENMWYDLTQYGAPNEIYWDVEYLPDSHTARFASYGRGIWDFTEDAATTETVGDNVIPTRFTVSQNYPNPFNPSTTISYELPKSSNVTLRIYSTMGQVVATLVDGRKEAGQYQVKWDAHVPSGTYFYRLQAGEYTETKKMTLLK